MVAYKEGDKSQAICSHCVKVVTTTIKSILTTNMTLMLVGVCDNCNTIVSIASVNWVSNGK